LLVSACGVEQPGSSLGS